MRETGLKFPRIPAYSLPVDRALPAHPGCAVFVFRGNANTATVNKRTEGKDDELKHAKALLFALFLSRFPFRSFFSPTLFTSLLLCRRRGGADRMPLGRCIADQSLKLLPSCLGCLEAYPLAATLFSPLVFVQIERERTSEPARARARMFRDAYERDANSEKRVKSVWLLFRQRSRPQLSLLVPVGWSVSPRR